MLGNFVSYNVILSIATRTLICCHSLNDKTYHGMFYTKINFKKNYFKMWMIILAVDPKNKKKRADEEEEEEKEREHDALRMLQAVWRNK